MDELSLQTIIQLNLTEFDECTHAQGLLELGAIDTPDRLLALRIHAEELSLLNTRLLRESGGRIGSRNVRFREAADEADRPLNIVEDSHATDNDDEYLAPGKKILRSSLCTACTEERPSFDVLDVATCKHSYCKDCLSIMFEGALANEAAFPVRCCKKPIIIGTITDYLEDDLVQRYRTKQIEMRTTDKTYCATLSCSAFLTPVPTSGTNLTCQACSAETCTLCKAFRHDGECEEDAGLREVTQMAKREGWQQCKACKRFVALETGCNHMTCRCKAEFCYVCGGRWKTCQCPAWDENNLLAAAARRIDRLPHFPANADEQNRAERIRQEAEHLREHHDCAHQTLVREPGEGLCAYCDDTLPTYILRCSLCATTMCKRCSIENRCGQGNETSDSDDEDCNHTGVKIVKKGQLLCEFCGDTMAEFILECRDCHTKMCNRCREDI